MSLYYAGAGVPTSGASGTLVGTAYEGDEYRDTNTNIIYRNYGSHLSPTWSATRIMGGTVVFTPDTAQVLVVGTTTTVNTGYEKVSSASAITITAHPAIATSGVSTGTRVYVQNTNASNAITLTDDGTDPGSKVKLRTGTTLAMAAGLVYGFIFDGTNWCVL